MEKIGQRIYELRLSHNISQDALVEQLGVSRQAISKWENSQSVPELEKIVLMSELFSVSLDYLVKGELMPETEVAKSENNEDSGFSGKKIKQIFGFVFLIFGLMMLFLNFVFSVPLIVEGLFLVFHKESDIKIIIGYSLFILMIVPFITIVVVAFAIGFVR
ncbi:MAG: helix-turn-helix transcriptional regulator [Eubacteriaceae bacterium]|nr:helix-turn-helix transcriptional regulator [Eubacteriaceae bacterium]